MMDKSHNGYEVLNPWAEADPTPFRGISPRLDALAGKKIGLLMNSKRAAAPTTQAIKRRLKEKFPIVGRSTAERASSTTRIVFQRRISRMLETGRGWGAWTNTPRSKWLRERTYSKVKSCA